MLAELSGGKVDYTVGVEVNKRLFDGYDLILSVGQVVPHEVVGMANYTKNMLIGTGGKANIDLTPYPNVSAWKKRFEALPGFGTPEQILPMESRLL